MHFVRVELVIMTDCVNIGTHVVTRAIWLKWLFRNICGGKHSLVLLQILIHRLCMYSKYY